jgi:single-stranded DNA-binding protein
MTTVNLVGFLGQDRQILDTRERTVTAWRYNDLAGRRVETEVLIPSQEFAVLSLAIHYRQRERRVTRWYRLVAWNVNRAEFRGVRLARKGDQVRVTGRLETVRITTPAGEVREAPQVIVDSFHLLRIKPRREWP